MIKRIISRLEQDSDRSKFLSVLRVGICFHLMSKLIINWKFLSILYGSSFVVTYEDVILKMLNGEFIRQNYQYFILLYSICITCYLFGIGKRFTGFLLYFLLEIYQRLNGYVLNGGDNFLKFIVLYMAFADSYNYLSVSSLKFRSDFSRKISNIITNLSAYSILFHICVVYFVSGISKLHSDLWYNGIATYYTLQLERFSGTRINDLLSKSGYFVTISTYFTMFWEVYFPVCIWIKKLRVPFIIAGIFVHLGIYVFMMIYDFELIFIMVYGLFFTNAEWNKILSSVRDLKPRLLAAKKSVFAWNSSSGKI